MGFFTEQVESIEEMAAPKMPEGVKRKRSDHFMHGHHIHIDGKPHSFIIGRPVRERGVPAHVKEYRVYKDEEDARNGWSKGHHGHPDHQHEETRSHFVPHPSGDYNKGKHETRTVKAPKPYGSMEEAIHAIHHTEKNKKEFGANHDPRDRWKHALAHEEGVKAHSEKTSKYKAAIAHVQATGHHDIADQLQKHHDAHVAAGTGEAPSKEKLHQWTHDAYHYTGTKEIRHAPDPANGKSYHSYSREPIHPEHHELAAKAHELHIKTSPHSWYYR